MSSRVTVADRAFALRDKAKDLIGGDDGAVMTKARTVLSGDGQFFSAAPKLDQIRTQLADSSISEKKEGMKRIIAGICKGADMSPLFPDVVKNIHVESIELRKLVYYYIVHYAEERPNESLLSISAFQKDLVNSSMHVRSLALRMLSSIRIPAIHPVVMVAIKKSSTDMSTVVRKTAAISLAQAHAVSGGEESQESIVSLIHHFFGDRSTEVLGAAALSYMEICPNQVQLIHKNYRRMCRALVDCDEWGQVVLLHILLRYARTQFVDPNAEKPKPKIEVVADEQDGDITTPETSDNESEDEKDDLMVNSSLKLHPDHRLLIQSAKPLLLSLNRAVVLSAVSLMFHIAPHSELDACVKPLLRLLNGRAEGHTMALSAIHTILLTRPTLFTTHIREFFLNSDDSNASRELKIRIIATLANSSNFSAVANEFRSYLRSFDIRKVVCTIRGLGIMSTTLTQHANQILQLIAPLMSHKSAEVVTESVVVLRQLVVQGSERATTCRIIHRLLVQLMKGEIKAPAARASVLWLVGENINSHVAIAKSAPDCFRMFAKTFITEDAAVKKQVLTLGSKLWFHLDGEGEVAERFKLIFFHVLELVKYDSDYELRDRGRMIETAVDRQSVSFAVLKDATLAIKPVPRQRDPFAEKAKYQVGSLSHLCGTALLGYQDLPSWPTEMPSPDARDPPTEKKSTGAARPILSSGDDDDSSAYSSSSSSSSGSDSDSEDSSSSSSGGSSSSSSSGSSCSSDSSDNSDSDESDSSSAASSPNIASSSTKKGPTIAARKLVATSVIRGGVAAVAKPAPSVTSQKPSSDQTKSAVKNETEVNDQNTAAEKSGEKAEEVSAAHKEGEDADGDNSCPHDEEDADGKDDNDEGEEGSVDEREGREEL